MTERSAKKNAPAARADAAPKATGRDPAATPATTLTATKPAKATDDVALVHGRTADGKGLKVLRKQGDTLSLGEVRPLKEGKPIQGEVVQLKPREDMPLLCDVEVQHAARHSAKARPAGPARVASTSYRSGWDGIWGKRRAKRSLN